MIPNLDAMDADELWAFWCKHQSGRDYRKLFPAGGRDTKRSTCDLAGYAANKATAIRCRTRGDIPGALLYEQIADRIYQRLPAFARW